MSNTPQRILVTCTGNRARSQMAEGWLRHLGRDVVEVRSAGTSPKGFHPLALEVIAESGIDISGQRSQHVSVYEEEFFDTVGALCNTARESYPVFSKAMRVLHREFEDPD